MSLKKYFSVIPWFLVISRLLLGPFLVGYLHYFKLSPLWIAALLSYAILSDIFDGIIARSLGTATAFLRRMDSQADLVFWVSSVIALWFTAPHSFRRTSASFRH